MAAHRKSTGSAIRPLPFTFQDIDIQQVTLQTLTEEVRIIVQCLLFIVQSEVISEILGDDSLAIINTICQCFCSFYIYTHIYKKQQCTVKKFDRQINRDQYLSSFFSIDLLSTHVKSCSVTWTVMIWRLFTVLLFASVHSSTLPDH